MVAILADVAAYVFSSLPYSIWDTRQISAVLPFGAVLAGPPAGRRPAEGQAGPGFLAVLLACYAAALGFDAVQPAMPAHDQPLADWLVAHDLTRAVRLLPRTTSPRWTAAAASMLIAASWGADRSVPARLPVRGVLVLTRGSTTRTSS